VHSDAAPDALGTSVAFDGESILSGAASKDSTRGAAYVFAPDVFTQQRLSTPSETSHFGHSVAVEGDTAIVGASTELRSDPQTGAWADGAAYIFVRSGANWVQQARLIPNDLPNGRQFGESVAISGNTVVVGAFTDRIGTNQSQGSAYVFVRSGASWTQQQKLTASDGAAVDWFGEKVAVHGDTIAVGAYRDDIGANQDQGSVYIFTRGGTNWTQAAKITAGDGAAFDSFGRSVALAGNTLIAGASGDDSAKGSAYVFTGSGSNWAFQQRLTANDGLTEDEFGKSVSLSGETAIIGAFADDNGTINQQGSAYVFIRSGANWTQQQKLIAADGAAVDFFGWSVSISGETAVVGTNFDDIAPNTNNGSAYVYVRNGTTWTQQSKLAAADAGNGDEFGFAVAIDGANIIVGADEKNLDITSSAGAAYIFTGTGAPVVNNRTAFDYDGDGKADLSVFRPSAASWYLSHSSNNAFIAVQFGANGDLIAPADFDGDRKTDISVFRPADGGWYRLNSSNNTFSALQFGSNGDLPVPGDFDGDSKADICVYRPSAGSWYRINSTNNQFIAAQFGIAEDKPLVGDFDGDGKSDLAVFRPSNGTWYRINSSSDTFSPNQFGTSEDKPVAADYDGDGKTDLAVYRPSVGDWYIVNSSNSAFTGIHFGVTEDKPAPADFDGDGKADLVVFRPSTGTWYLLRTTAG
ncbi:MAG TPA: FG-GAP-like repeat-containing protein, partial [Pyrinomonadaceae bacterium]